MQTGAQNLQLTPGEALEQRSLRRLEGFWKVVHHGKLSPPAYPERTARLSIYFRRLANQVGPRDSPDFETEGPAIPVSVPAAELMRLPLNVVVRDSKVARDPCLPLPSERLDHLQADLSEEKVKLISRYARFEGADDDSFIIPYQEGRSPHPDSGEGKSFYVAIEHEEDPFGLIIPCSEVFRFFYCTSSQLANTILSERILDVDRYIIDPSRSGLADHDPQLAVVWLRQWMFNSDRRHIARLFFTPGAFEEAKNVFLRASGYSEPAYERALIALPPLHGNLKLTCITKRFVSDNRERLFVTRLVSTNWTLPFREVHFGRDNDGRRSASDEERLDLPEHGRHQRPKVLAQGAQIKTLEDKPADNSIEPIELDDIEFASRFPELDKIRSPQIDKQNQTTKNDKGKKVLPLANGTLVEGAGNHDGLINTILRALERASEVEEDQRARDDGSSASVEEVTVEPSCKLVERIEDIEAARTDPFFSGRLEVAYLPILEQLGLLKGKPVNVLPTSIDGKSPAWLFLDSVAKQRPRPVLVVRLTLDNKVRYLIDFMHKDGKRDTASLLLWHPEQVPVIHQLLKYAIRTCMRNRAVNLENGDLLKDFCGRPLKHTTFKDDAPRHVHLVEKIFSAEDHMGKWICGFGTPAEDVHSAPRQA